MILFPVYHSIYKLYSKNRTFVLFFCKNKAQDNILSHALLCYALPFILHCLFYTILFTIASASASSSAFWSACIADLMVSPVSRIVISFISLIFSLTCFAAVGAQVPFSISPTVRFWKLCSVRRVPSYRKADFL